MPTVAAGANPQARGTRLRARDHPKTHQNRSFLIDIAAIRKRRKSRICNRSKFLIDSKLAVLEGQKRTKGEARRHAMTFSNRLQLGAHHPRRSHALAEAGNA